MSVTQHIYLLRDPRSRRVRWVGISTNPTQRLAQHAQRGPCSVWIKWLRAIGERPILEVVEMWPDAKIYTDGYDGAYQAEKWWMRHLIERDEPLMNNNGRGGPHPWWRDESEPEEASA